MCVSTEMLEMFLGRLILNLNPLSVDLPLLSDVTESVLTEVFVLVLEI